MYAELLKRAYKYMRTDEGAFDRRLTESKGPKEKRRKGRAPVEPSKPPTQSGLTPTTEPEVTSTAESEADAPQV